MKKNILYLTIMALLLFEALPAKTRRIGAEVRVSMTDGSNLHGELCAIDLDRISVRCEQIGLFQGRLAQVAHILVLRLAGPRGKKAAKWLGAALGFGVGFYTPSILGCQRYYDICTPTLTAIGGAIAGSLLISGLSRMRGERRARIFLIQDQSDEALEAAVRELNEQARDRRE